MGSSSAEALKHLLLRGKMEAEEQEGLAGLGDQDQMPGGEACAGRKPGGADSRH